MTSLLPPCDETKIEPASKLRPLDPRRRVVKAFLISLPVIAFESFVWLVARPLHMAGHFQGILWPFNALGRIVDLPGLLFMQFMYGHANVNARPWGEFMLLGLNSVIYTLAIWFYLFLLNGYVPRGRSGKDRQASSQPVEPAEPPVANPIAVSRRAFLGGVSSGALALTGGTCGAGAALAYTLFWEPRELPLTQRTFQIEGLPPELDGLRIMHLSDIHHGPWMTVAHLQQMVSRVNALNPDLILMTGDFVHQSHRYFGPVTAELAQLRAKIGILSVMGNHDWWEGGALCKEAFKDAGLPLIDNARMILTPDRKLAAESKSGLCLAGIGDLWEDKTDFRKAFEGVPDEMPRILMSHNPDVAELPELSKKEHRVDLMLSGHTHGGQVWVPFLGTPVTPSKYGQKYSQGLVQGPGCRVYVSRGIGVTGLPLRFRVPPEIALLELKRAIV